MKPPPPTQHVADTRRAATPAPTHTRRRLRTAVRTAAGLVIAVALLGVISLWWPEANTGSPARAADNADGVEWHTARKQSFDLTVIESGQLEAARKVEIKSKVDGRPAIIEVVDEGAFVKKGDLLVKLDDADVAQKLEAAELKLETARSAKVKAEQDLAIQINESDSARREAEVTLQLAELEFAEWDQGEVPTQKRKLKLALEKAQREVERTRRNFETDQELFKQRFISRDELDDSEIATIEAIDELATANLDIEVYEKYTYLKEQQEKQSAVDQAKAELERTLAKNESKLAQMRDAAQSKARALAIQDQSVTDLKQQIVDSTIYAPKDGMVIYASSTGNRWNRSEPITPGRQVRRSETIIILPDVSQLVAVLNVPEALAPQVQPGQPADTRVDAIAGEVFPGEVESVSVLAQDGGFWSNNVKNFTVRVLLPPNAGNGALKPTMTCTGTIYTGRVEDALTVPLQAVFAEGPQHYVYVSAGGGRVKRQNVTIGQASETLVQIKEGITPGTEVLLRAPRPGEEAEN